MFTQHHPMQFDEKVPSNNEAENMDSFSLKWHLDSIQEKNVSN